MVFYPKERKFEGSPVNTDTVKIRIIATDETEKSVFDEFDITIDYSFLYVLG